MSDQPGSSNPPKSTPQPKAIASLAKKQSDVTRLGSSKLKFVPTLPARRKKNEVKTEEPAPASTSTERGRGRGRGEGRGRGRGRGGEGRGAAPRPPAVEMTASGPFAMGPTLAGSSARRVAPRSNFTPIIPQGPGAAQRLGAGLSQTAAPALGVKREPNDLGSLTKGKAKSPEDEGEVYSDPDEGVEILDMENVRTMDWMAPETLKREKQAVKKEKKEHRAKVDLKGKGPAKPDNIEVSDEEDAESSKVNLANAVHLSDSEEEEEMEDIIDDFSLNMAMDVDNDIGQERLYFFQFPNPLPSFLSKKGQTEEEPAPAPNDPLANPAQQTKTENSRPTDPIATKIEGKSDTETAKVDGVVGQLEIYRSGAVKMRLGNDMVLDVTPATQPSFLQHAVYVDPEHKRMTVLGEVNRRFMVSPDIDSLLASLERAEQAPPSDLDADGLLRMDTS